MLKAISFMSLLERLGMLQPCAESGQIQDQSLIQRFKTYHYRSAGDPQRVIVSLKNPQNGSLPNRRQLRYQRNMGRRGNACPTSLDLLQLPHQTLRPPNPYPVAAALKSRRVGVIGDHFAQFGKRKFGLVPRDVNFR